MRTGFLVLFGVVALGFIAFFWSRAGAGSQAQASATPVLQTVLAAGPDSGVQTRENYVITSQDELKRLWGLIELTTPLPAVDFTKDEVIAVFAGSEPRAGYAIQVSKIADSASERTITVLITTPGPSCAGAPVASAPYQVLEIPKTLLPLAHEDIATTTPCSGR